MPRSRSKRSRYIAPKPAKPKPAPRWVPAGGFGLILAGAVVVILSFLLTLPGGNLTLLGGFVLMGTGLGLLSQWR